MNGRFILNLVIKNKNKKIWPMSFSLVLLLLESSSGLEDTDSIPSRCQINPKKKKRDSNINSYPKASKSFFFQIEKEINGRQCTKIPKPEVMAINFWENTENKAKSVINSNYKLETATSMCSIPISIWLSSQLIYTRFDYLSYQQFHNKELWTLSKTRESTS